MIHVTPKIPTNCKLVVERFGKIKKYGETRNRPFVLHCIPDSDEATTIHTNTTLIPSAVEFLAIAVRTIKPKEILFYDAHLEAAWREYDKLPGAEGAA